MRKTRRRKSTAGVPVGELKQREDGVWVPVGPKTPRLNKETGKPRTKFTPNDVYLVLYAAAHPDEVKRAHRASTRSWSSFKLALVAAKNYMGLSNNRVRGWSKLEQAVLEQWLTDSKTVYATAVGIMRTAEGR